MSKPLKRWTKHYASNTFGVYVPVDTDKDEFRWLSASNIITNLAIYLQRYTSASYQKELVRQSHTNSILKVALDIEWPEYLLADLTDMLDPSSKTQDEIIGKIPYERKPLPGVRWPEVPGMVDGTGPTGSPLEIDTLPGTNLGSQLKNILDLENLGSGYIVDKEKYVSAANFAETADASNLTAGTEDERLLSGRLADSMVEALKHYMVSDASGKFHLESAPVKLGELVRDINAIIVNPGLSLYHYNAVVVQILKFILEHMTADSPVDKAVIRSLASGVGGKIGPVIQGTSPIGIMHVYEQQLTHADEGYGPILQVLALQPGEQLDVLLETESSSQYESSSEIEESVELTRSEKETVKADLSEEVATKAQRSSSIAVGASGGANFAVWNASANASSNSNNAYSRSDRIMSKNLRSHTRQVSERRTRKVRVVTRTTETESTRQSERRTIRNDFDDVRNYALRQIHREIEVDVFRQQPRLVWNLYLSEPARHMNQSKYVFFEDDYGLLDPRNVVDLPPYPPSGVIRKSVTVTIVGNKIRLPFVMSSAEMPVGVEITTIRDLAGPRRKSRDRHASLNDNFISLTTGDGKSREEALKADPYKATSWVAEATITAGDGYQVSVDYEVRWEPSPVALAEIDDQRKQLLDKFTYEQSQEIFYRKREHIESRSNIRSRPAADLRSEERFAVMNRLISHIYGSQLSTAVPPGEMESIRSLFDLDEIFIFVHPSWWKPKSRDFYAERYAVTPESEPAPLGASLGWILQLDGDDKRNYFLNSPWVQVCVPMVEGREEEATEWMARNVEGFLGVPGHSAEQQSTHLREHVEEMKKSMLDQILKDTVTDAEGDALSDEQTEKLATGQYIYRLFDEKIMDDNVTKKQYTMNPVDSFRVMDVTEGLAYQSISLTDETA
ncbi:hypothetical protein N9850_04170 [Granulosicoccus sp.]|nr:hypothetical protein [Granulosicoccus sp.]MDB4222945.1 hypothetical protein [Granulosicoccus sp.]